jgi:hydroxymethylglutaryl-CoA reductase
MINSELPGFYRLALEKRRDELARVVNLSVEDREVLSGERSLKEEHADRMVENAIGLINMPLGLCANMMINGRDRLIPMATEEPSVIAAASYAAKLLRQGGGVVAHVSPAHMVGQIQLMDVPEIEEAKTRIFERKEALLALANQRHARLRAAGGGAIDLEIRVLPPMDENDPLGTMLIVHLVVDVCDAMGANAINAMCERIAPDLAELSKGRVRLRILSNLSDKRRVIVRGAVPFSALNRHDGFSGYDLARGIEEASVFAERDPYRAATHNKGVMNGIDAVLVAFGQDWRAVEAGAHAFASRNGRYTALARWRVGEGELVGELEVPMAVGTVGGIVDVHPTVGVARRISRVNGAADLASLVAAVGLAQNLGALRALAAEGIQRGHMALHARKIALQAGATTNEISRLAEIIAQEGTININAAKEVLLRLRAA